MDALMVEHRGSPLRRPLRVDLARGPFTTREWGWIKKHSGYLPLTVEEGFRGADPELITVFAVIALHRAGKIQTADVVGGGRPGWRTPPPPATIRLETRHCGGGDGSRSPHLAAKFEQERRLFWARFVDELGDIGEPRVPSPLGSRVSEYFGVGP